MSRRDERFNELSKFFSDQREKREREEEIEEEIEEEERVIYDIRKMKLFCPLVSMHLRILL